MKELLGDLATKKENIGITLIFLVLAAFIAVTTHYGTKSLSAVRAYEAGKGQWTKAQDQFTQQLLQYCITEDPVYYQRARRQFRLHQGFKQARKALTGQFPNPTLAREGLREAGIHPRDIDLVIWLTTTFGSVERMQNAFATWKRGEEYIAKLDSLGNRLHNIARVNGQMRPEIRSEFVTNIATLDQSLSNLEHSFSETLGSMARWVRAILFWSIIGSGAVLIVSGYLVTNRFFRDIRDLTQQVARKEKQFRTVLDHSRDVIFELDLETGEYNYVSPQIERQLGYPVEYIIEEGQSFILNRIHPDDVPKVQQDLKEIEENGTEGAFREVDYRIQTKEGNYIWVNAQRSLVRNENGDPVAIVGNVREITQRKEHELQTEQSLEQKRTLLEEIHHRIKNNLAIISSILELQKQEPRESMKEVLEDTQARIQSIATIHEKLYQTDTLSDIDMQEYIRDFSDVVVRTFNSGQKDITIKKELDQFSLDIKKAVPVGLIVNELMSNAFKHGFADLEDGELRISLVTSEGEAVLSVSDNGHSLPENFSLDNSSSLGITLINTLATQLEGEVEVTQNGWTTFAVTFPLS